MNECRHGLSEDCPGCMQETIDAQAKALRELPSIIERVEAFRETEIPWLVKELGDSIANLGYPVGMGIAPQAWQLKRAAEALFERWCKMVSKIASFAPAQCALDGEARDKIAAIVGGQHYADFEEDACGCSQCDAEREACRKLADQILALANPAVTSTERGMERPSTSAMHDLICAIIEDDAKYDSTTNTWDTSKAATAIIAAFDGTSTVPSTDGSGK